MNGKIYYTDEDLNTDHNRFRICKNKGNDCNKEEFMVKHASSKFCSEDCNNKYSNWEKQQINRTTLPAKENNIKILKQLLQNRRFPIVSFKSLIDSNFIFEEMDAPEFILSLRKKALVFNEFIVILWKKDMFLITKK